jgi:hypothetical protein
LAFAVVIGFDPAFQLGKEGFRVAYRFVRLIAGIAAALVAVRVVEHLDRSLLIRIGPSSAPEMNYPASVLFMRPER